MKIHIVVLLMLCFAMLIVPALAVDDDADDEDTFDDNSGSSVIQGLVNPLNGVHEVLSSPAGKPLKKIINLVVGFAIICTLFALIKDYLHTHSDNSEKSSSGFINMGKHTGGFLILLVCLGFVGYFMNYSL